MFNNHIYNCHMQKLSIQNMTTVHRYLFPALLLNMVYNVTIKFPN
jgi:hypothetical protein